MITLNTDQETALETLYRFVMSPTNTPSDLDLILGASTDVADRVFVLTGSAGTGKSTTIQHLLKRLPYLRVALTAPTNKAVKVIARMRAKHVKANPQDERKQDTVCTVHKLLGLTIKYNKDSRDLVQEAPSKASEYNLIIIDEGSMVNKALVEFIERELDIHSNLKVIYMADPCQLPPVGESHSEIFSRYQSIHLSKVERQAAENPVLELCTELRDLIESHGCDYPTDYPTDDSKDRPTTHSPKSLTQIIKPKKHGKSGVHVVNSRTFEETILDRFSVEKYNFDTIDKFRVIAWTNKMVNKWNARIQHHRYPDLGDLPFAIGEPCVVADPLLYATTIFHEGLMYPETKENGIFAMYAREAFNDKDELNWKSVLLPTETEGIIERVEKIEDFVFKPLASHIRYKKTFDPIVIPAYKVTIQVVDEGNSYFITCIVPESRDQLDKLYKRMVKLIKDESEFFLTWKDFWITKAIFTDLRPVYALTSHKSQGSTFDHVFIEYNDIMSNFDYDEALKSLYVATSRTGLHGNAVFRA